MLKHPDIHTPASSWSEEQVLHIAACYINPFRSETRRKLFNDFRRHMASSPNVVLHVGEVAFGDRPWEVTGEDPNDVQFRTNTVLWHKECVLNEVVKHFPYGWQRGGYCDGDFHMTRYDWALEAIHMLQHHKFVQLFSGYADLTPETSTSINGHRPFRMNSSFAWNYTHQEEFKSRKAVQSIDRYTSGYGSVLLEKTKEFPFGFSPGAPGGAWAWTREAFDAVGGLLDTHIVGGGDWHMALGLIGMNSAKDPTRPIIEGYLQDALRWQERAKVLNKNIGCVDNFATHGFHGAPALRLYSERWKILQRWHYNPLTDISKDWQGLWKFNGNKPEMEREIHTYNLNRNEDSNYLALGSLI